jgi:hypothetical protein
MLLEPATQRNVSRAIREINGFEWEGDFKPMAPSFKRAYGAGLGTRNDRVFGAQSL